MTKPINIPRKRKVAIYTRYSSDLQSHDSTVTQIKVVKKFAARKSIQIDDDCIYSDEETTGRNTKRQEFQKLVEAILNDEIELLCFYSVSRLTRNLRDGLDFLELIDKHKVKLYSVKERLTERPEDRNALQHAMCDAEDESRITSERVLDNQIERALNGERMGGRAPLGYDAKDKTLVINDEESIIVRKVFDWFLAGKTFEDISNWAKIHGYKTKNGNGFTTPSLKDLLRNEVYMGTLVFNRLQTPNINGRANGHAYKDQDEIVRIKGCYPAIVSEEEWLKAQHMLEEKTGNKQVSASFYLLSRKVRCKHCNRAMAGTRDLIDKAKGQYERYYAREKTDIKNNCGNPRRKIRAGVLEDPIINQITSYISNPKVVEILVHMINEQIHQTALCDSEVKCIETQLKLLKKKKGNLLDLVENNGHDDDAWERIKKYSAEMKSLEEQRTLLLERSTPSFVTNDEIMKLVNNLHSVLMDDQLQETKRWAVIRSFVEEVYFSGNSFDVVYKNLPMIK